jgi:hypothetical protein
MNLRNASGPPGPENGRGLAGEARPRENKIDEIVIDARAPVVKAWLKHRGDVWLFKVTNGWRVMYVVEQGAEGTL